MTSKSLVPLDSSNHAQQLTNLDVPVLEKALKVKSTNFGRYVTHNKETAGDKFKKFCSRVGHLFKLQWLNDKTCLRSVQKAYGSEAKLRDFYAKEIGTKEGASEYIDSIKLGLANLEKISNLFKDCVIYNDVRTKLNIAEWEKLVTEAEGKINEKLIAPGQPKDKPQQLALEDVLPPPPFNTPPPPPPSDIPPGVEVPVIPIDSKIIGDIRAEVDRQRKGDVDEDSDWEGDSDWDLDVNFDHGDYNVTYVGGDEPKLTIINRVDNRKYVELFNAQGKSISIRNFGSDKYDEAGRNEAGFDRKGWDKEGYDKDGFNAEGKNRQGANRHGVFDDGSTIYGAKGSDKEPAANVQTAARSAAIADGSKALVKILRDNPTLIQSPILRNQLLSISKNNSGEALENAFLNYLNSTEAGRKFIQNQNQPGGIFHSAGIAYPEDDLA